MSIAGRTVPIAATHIYQMSFFTGFGVSALVYCLLNYFFPPRGSRFVGGKLDERDVSDDVEEEEEGDCRSVKGSEKGKDEKVAVYEYDA